MDGAKSQRPREKSNKAGPVDWLWKKISFFLDPEKD